MEHCCMTSSLSQEAEQVKPTRDNVSRMGGWTHARMHGRMDGDMRGWMEGGGKV